MTNEKATWPWDKHAVSQEAEKLVAQSRAERNLARHHDGLTWKDKLKTSTFLRVFVALAVSLPFVTIWALVDLFG